jgi:tetratricopeptide (TPR) repeat protein
VQISKPDNLRQAREHIADGRLSSAMAIYQKIVDADSSDLAAISMLGDLYVKTGRIADAVEHFLRVAESFLRSGSAISAAYILKKVLKIDPANPTAHMNLGELHVQDNKVDRAHDSFIEAAAGFWHAGDKAASIRLNRRALEVVPSSRLAKAALALIKRELEQPVLPEPKKQITRDLPEILISIPDDSDAASNSGTEHSAETAPQPSTPLVQDEDLTVEQIATAELLVGCGQIDRAIGLLRESLQDSPDHLQLREKLKDIYLRSGMIDRASEECVNIAAIYSAQGNASRSIDYVLRARLLKSSAEPVPLLAGFQTGDAEGVREPSVAMAS